MPPESMRPLPSSAELDKLVAAFRDNPRSTSFLPLAEAYLALGRPRDAAEALTRGLVNHPDHLEARIALGRAHVQLHEWKEAQVELLKVVKVDRSSREGFRLLGEVLMRRQDFERALPVLQRAADLDPANGRLLAMLRRAREGRPLDAPPPPPTPIAPAGSGAGVAPRPPMPAAFEEATRVAPDGDDDGATDAGMEAPTGLMDDGNGRKGAPPPAVPPPRPGGPPLPAPPRPRESPDVLGKMPLEKQGVRAAEERVSRKVADDREAAAPPPAPRRAPLPPAEDPFRPITERRADPVQVDAAEPARPPREKPAAVPRGTQAAPNKQKDLGAPEMRRSAAVGEDYLNSLLAGGLLAVPNVEAREQHTDPEMRRRWRAKTRNAFIVLFVMLTLIGGGAVGFVYYTNKAKDEKVAKRLAKAKELVAAGRLVDLDAAEEELRAAYDLDKSSSVVVASLAEAYALDFFVYGGGSLNEVDGFVSAASGRLRKAKGTVAGKREYLIALAARNLAVIDKAADPAQAGRETREALDEVLKLAPADGMALYLDGMLRLALGDHAGARQAFEKADEGGKGPAIARIAIGDLLLDAGDAKGALEAYEAALKRAPGHPMALVGRALARVDRSSDAEAAMQDLNVGLSGVAGVRVVAWKDLAMASVWAYLEDYEKSQASLEAAAKSGLGEPRFQARVALLGLDRGRIVEAGQRRQKIRFVGEAPGKDPLLLLLDAELFMASGMPEDALGAVGVNPTLRGHLVKGRALIDLDKPKEALAEFDAALAISPEDARAKAYRELARVLEGKRGAGSDAAFEALAKLARSSVSGLTRYVLAEAYLAKNQPEDARRALEASLEGDNPLAYRARTRLAEVYLAAGRVADAEKALREGLAQSPVYVPAHAALGRILLQQGKTEEAAGELDAAVQAGRATAADELAYATALVALGKKEEAKAPTRRAKDKGAPAEQVGAVAASIDPAFAEELGVPVPEGPEAPKPNRRRRGGR